MKRNYLLVIFLTWSFLSLWGQATKQEIFDKIEKTAGVHYVYPTAGLPDNTPSPKGYIPFYISHFSRHGSRYLISDSQYKYVLDLLSDANKRKVLTPLGEDVYIRMLKVWAEVEYRGGDLSPAGVREHRGIAERMFNSFPEVFKGDIEIDACATTVLRCALSMDAFCERLKELNPSLKINRDASMYHQRYLNHHTKEAIAYRSAQNTWKEQYSKFEKSHVHADRLVKSLFSDEEYILKQVNLNSLMWGLYEIAGGMQNIETNLSFYDIFEKQELFDLWQCNNYKTYVNDANYTLNGGLMFENCKPLLSKMVDRANEVIESGSNGADLRFAHDGNLIPLALLLHLDGCYNSEAEPSEFYKAWCNFKVAPMAGNIQMIFFRKKNSDDILVKFLLHEKEILVPLVKTDIAPYYHWRDIENFYQTLLDKQ
ncbi:MAG: histidine-type phosphatase [Dysgonomonas sp.]